MISQLNFIPYFITLFLFTCIDFLWLFSTSHIYKKYLTHLLSPNVNWIGILLFYPLYALGLYIFVIKPFDGYSSLISIFLQAAFFGMVAYGTYDLTNYATLKEWPGFLVVVDLFWGAFISGSVSVATVCVLRWISHV
ncbi:MAG: DUF2177 family protein [Candidatus Babeliales bacterium]|nr:DUF2177 family protein [Candidatus Babeliales bacterium]